MDVVQCVDSLTAMGFAFRLDEAGVARVKCPAEHNPRADEMLRFLRIHKAELRAEIGRRQPVQTAIDIGRIELLGVDAESALGVAELIKRGRAELLAPVVYHPKTDTFDVICREVEPDGDTAGAGDH